MASIYERAGSSFWWIKFRNPISGKIERESTGYHIGTGGDMRKARELEARKTLDERQAANTKLGAWNGWVPKWLEDKISNVRTLERYRNCWQMLRLFLKENNVAIPRQLTRDHCFSYPAWRKHPDKRNGKYRAGKNTALLELKILGMIMKEAVWREFAPANPCRELGLAREARKIFPEYTDEDLQIILNAIELESEPGRTRFRNSFLVARYHGVRLNETNVNPMVDVKLWEENGAVVGSIRFFQKGGKVRVKPLHPQLIPLFQELQSKKSTHTYPPPGAGWRSQWTRLLQRCGIKDRNPHACFHSLRVTVKSRLRRAGIDKETAMEYLSHEPSDVDESYNRFTLADLRKCHGAL